MTIRLTPPWRTASAVCQSRASSRSSAGWTRSSASPSDSPPRKRCASSRTWSAPTNAASSSSGGIASSLPPRHSASSGQSSTCLPGRDDLGRLERAGQVAREDEVEVDIRERVAGGGGLLAAARRQRHVLRVHRHARLVDVRDVAVPHQDQPSSHVTSERLLDLAHPFFDRPAHDRERDATPLEVADVLLLELAGRRALHLPRPVPNPAEVVVAQNPRVVELGAVDEVVQPGVGGAVGAKRPVQRRPGVRVAEEEAARSAARRRPPAAAAGARSSGGRRTIPRSPCASQSSRPNSCVQSVSSSSAIRRASVDLPVDSVPTKTTRSISDE